MLIQNWLTGIFREITTLIPSMRQFSKWTLPSKWSFISGIFATIALAFMVLERSEPGRVGSVVFEDSNIAGRDLYIDNRTVVSPTTSQSNDKPDLAPSDETNDDRATVADDSHEPAIEIQGAQTRTNPQQTVPPPSISTGTTSIRNVDYVERYRSSSSTQSRRGIAFGEGRMPWEGSELLGDLDGDWEQFLKPAAYRDGVFNRLREGDIGEVEKLELRNSFDLVVVVDHSEELSQIQAIEGAARSTRVLQITSIDLTSGASYQFKEISVSKLGQSPNTAAERSFEELTSRFIDFLE